VGGREAPGASNGRLVNVDACHRPGSQAAPGCSARWPACVEHSMASDPDRHRVVSTRGGDSKNGRARCPRQPSPGTCAQRRSPSSSRCHQRRSAAGRRRACCPTSAPWAATDATPTSRSGPCWKPCPSHPRPASRAPRLTALAPLLSVALVVVRILLCSIGIVSDRARGTSSVRETIGLIA
jgi:hypothetical protein